MPTVIILGASSGLGYSLAEVYLKRGWNLGLAARRTEPMQQLARLCKPQQRVEIMCIDVCQPHEAAEKLAQMCQKLGNHIDLYLHCSGIGHMTPKIDYNDEVNTLQTNVMGWTACIDWAYEQIIRQKQGQIASITSFAANRGLAPAPAYSATKAFQAHYLEALRQRVIALGYKDICITDLRPGFVDTPLLAHPERLFWVLNTPKATTAMINAIDHRQSIATVTLRWKMLAPILRAAPRKLLSLILRQAL